MDSTNKLKGYGTYAVVLLVVLLALAVRIFHLDTAPTSVNWDEASQGYNAFSLLHTGKDEYSKPLPISLRSFDDYKPAVYAYFIVPLLTFRPLSDVTTRIPSAVIGSLLPLSLFVITYALCKSKKLGLLAAVLLAFEPWAVHFSRIAFEANVANSIIFLGIALFLAKKYSSSLTMFILSMYTYHSERMIALPIVLCLVVIYRIQPIRRYLPLGLLLLPLALSFFIEPVTSRLTSTSLLRLWPFVPQNYSWLIFNPLYTLLWHLSGQFFSYFSPYNLFVRGSTEPGQYIPTLGLFQAIEFPLWLTGLLVLPSKMHMRKFLLPLMLLAVLPGLITWNWFSVVRTLTLYPLFTILVCLGVWEIGKVRQHHLAEILFFGLMSLIWTISAIYLLCTEIVFAPAVTYGEYQPGFEKAVPVLMANASNYDHVIIDSPHIAPYIFLLFYSQYDPHLYQRQVPKRVKNSGTESLPFGKFEFREINWVYDKHLPHTLFMGPTVRLPDYEFANSSFGKILYDAYDINGYIDLRIAATN